jgi:DNA-binding NarL/FixJ family response regulator
MTPVIFKRPERRRYRHAIRTLVLVADPPRLSLCTGMIREAGGVCVVGDPDGGDLARQCGQIRPDVIIIGESGCADTVDRLVRKLMMLHPGARVLVIGDTSCVLRVRTMQALGALGYLSWDSAAIALVEGIRDVAKGGSFVGPGIGRVMLEPVPAGGAERLTVEEIDVLRHLAAGLSVRLVAMALGLSVRTVGRRLISLRQKLGAATTIETVQVARRRGYLPLGLDLVQGNGAIAVGKGQVQEPAMSAGGVPGVDRTWSSGRVGPAPGDHMK